MRQSIMLLCMIPILMTSSSCRQSPISLRAKDPDCIPRQTLNNIKVILAAWQGNVDVIRAMIKDGADVNASDELFGTPMVAAASSGSYESVKLLLDNNASVNAIDHEGYTPLMKAALNGYPEVVRLLISRGADVNAATYPLINGKRTDKFTALLIAEWKKNEEIITMLKEAGAKE